MARRANRRFAAVLAGTLFMTGCGTGEEPEVAAPTTVPPATDEAEETTAVETEAAITSSPPSATLTAQELDEADVEDTLHRYTRALDDAFNGDASVESIYPYARDAAREQWITEVMASQAQGTTSSGLTELDIVEVSVEGDVAEVLACADVTDVQAVDEAGNSVIASDRLDRTLQDFLLERDDSAEFGWYVVEDTNRNEPCEG